MCENDNLHALRTGHRHQLRKERKYSHCPEYTDQANHNGNRKSLL